jgi:hypothetical protein
MRCAALLATLALLPGCGSSGGVADEELGQLVVAPKHQADAIDTAKAAKDPGELSRALARPYRESIKALGPHTLAINTSTQVDEAGQRVSDLSDHMTLELGDKDSFHGVYTNSADYGREVYYLGGTLYLRPRYQRFHGRAPESPDEPFAIRDSFADAIAATWDLVSPGAELTDGGAAQVSGRAGRKIVIKLARSPRTPASEPLAQRKWREKRIIEGVCGEIVLDNESGALLSATLEGVVSFMRDGRRFKMNVTADASVSAIGTAVSLTAPPPDQVVATPERLREVDDRDFLLQGIAPPSRRNPDGTPVAPAPRAFEDSPNPPAPAQVAPHDAGSGAGSGDEPPKKKHKKRHSDDDGGAANTPAE